MALDNVGSVEQPVDAGSADNIEHSTPDTGSSKQSLTDLDKLDRFIFNGKEMSRENLKSAYMAHSDYTRKSQAMAQERKFMDNLEADLDLVRNNPSLAEQFRTTYPQAYHRFLRFAAGEGQSQTQSQRPQGTEANPEIGSLKSQIQELREFQNNIQLKELETQFSDIYNSSIKSKYKWVDEDGLAGLAREALQAGYQLRNDHGKIDAGVLEKIARSANEKMEKKFQEYQKGMVDKQRAANTKARDIGSGGGIAGQAPKKLSWGDATKEYERRLTGSQS